MLVYNQSKAFLHVIELSRYLSADFRNVIQRNCFSVHPENLWLSRIWDDHYHIRELAVRRILVIRNRDVKGSNILRKVQVPTINFQAGNYVDMVDWQQCEKQKPPLTISCSIWRFEWLFGITKYTNSEFYKVSMSFSKCWESCLFSSSYGSFKPSLRTCSN